MNDENKQYLKSFEIELKNLMHKYSEYLDSSEVTTSILFLGSSMAWLGLKDKDTVNDYINSIIEISKKEVGQALIAVDIVSKMYKKS